MADYIITRTSPDELAHFGIKGQKWGVRRFENVDGTLTDSGKKRYRKLYKKEADKAEKLRILSDKQEQARIVREQDAKMRKARSFGTKSLAVGLGGGILNFPLSNAILNTKNKYNIPSLFRTPGAQAVGGSAFLIGTAALVATCSYGKAVYHKIKKSSAMRRLNSDKGHERALKKYEVQCKKMLDLFGEVPSNTLG